MIVSPRFPPVNAADHQRVRMMLPYLRAGGWKAVVLCVDSEFVEGVPEPDLLLTMPDDVEVVRCRAFPQRISRRMGFGSLTFRAYPSLRAAGDQLLRTRRFDLVFFSTTEFGILPLGKRWKKRFGVPFVVDIQDPWVNRHYRDTRTRPPGGHFKHGVTQMIARVQEGPTLREAAQIISVSPQYPGMLRDRHPELRDAVFSVIPFAGSRHDFDVAAQTVPVNPYLLPDDGRIHMVYAGAAPAGIRPSILAFLLALKRAADEGIVEQDGVRVHFVGTDYAPEGIASNRVRPATAVLGLSNFVIEHPARIPYLETLRLLIRANALLVFGWDDPTYTGSKLYPYILARRPLLSVLHEQSSANEVVRRTGAGVSVCFNKNTKMADLADEIFKRWFLTRSFEVTPPTDWNEFLPFEAESMTKRVVEVFSRASKSPASDHEAS